MGRKLFSEDNTEAIAAIRQLIADAEGKTAWELYRHVAGCKIIYFGDPYHYEIGRQFCDSVSESSTVARFAPLHLPEPKAIERMIGVLNRMLEEAIAAHKA